MNNPPVLIFDGVCSLCNGLVHFVLRHEKQPLIRFTPLQSEQAKALFKKHHINQPASNSVVFIVDDRVFLESEAAFKLAGYLKFPYSTFVIFKILPLFITNGFYRVVANNRYKVFGKRDSCMVPDAHTSKRFL